MLKDPKYKENAVHKSKIFNDRLSDPLEEAVYWTEYVIRHKGAPHLRSPVKDLAWYQFYLIDIFVFIFAIFWLIMYILYCIASMICCRFKRKGRVIDVAKKRK